MYVIICMDTHVHMIAYDAYVKSPKITTQQVQLSGWAGWIFENLQQFWWPICSILQPSNWWDTKMVKKWASWMCKMPDDLSSRWLGSFGRLRKSLIRITHMGYFFSSCGAWTWIRMCLMPKEKNILLISPCLKRLWEVAGCMYGICTAKKCTRSCRSGHIWWWFLYNPVL